MLYYIYMNKHKYIYIFLLFIIITFLLTGIFNTQKRYKLIEQDYISIENQKSDIEKKLKINTEKLENIMREEGKEFFLRNTYSIKKEDEEILTLYDNSKKTFEISKENSNTQQFFDFLKDIFNFNK